MSGKNGPDDVAHYGRVPFVDPAIGEGVPVGAWITGDAVCRDCMTSAEEISMRRGYADPISIREAEEKNSHCARCGMLVSAGS